jgi:hypothetical protein
MEECMSLLQAFLLGVAGGFGAVITFFALALCKAAARGDRALEQDRDCPETVSYSWQPDFKRALREVNRRR